MPTLKMTRMIVAICVRTLVFALLIQQVVLIQQTVCAQSSRYVQTYGSTSAPTNKYAPASKYAAPTQTMRMQKAASGRGYDFSDAIKSGGYNRTFSVHVPPSYDRARPMPVVLAFHGLGLNGKAMKYITLFDQVADRNGFIVVYPDGLAARWNDGLQKSNVDDVQFVSDMLTRLSQVVAIDGRHVYACGLSNGGYFVQRLASELGNGIAAIGVVGSTGVQPVLARNRNRMPIIFFLGTADPLIVQEGDSKALGKLGELVGLGDLGALTPDIAQLGGVMTTNQVIGYWVGQNGCSLTPRSAQMPDRSTGDGCRVRCDSYGNSVVVYTIINGGHTWPGGMPFGGRDIVGATTQDINASQIMWDFFRSQ